MFRTKPCTDGSFTLEDSRGERMHSDIGPMREARELYVIPSKLSERLLSPEPTPLVIYDVGLGLAANALAAIECLKQQTAETLRPLHIISFETNTEGLRFALKKLCDFEFLKPHAQVLEALLSSGHVQQSGLNWELKGDFRNSLQGIPPADLIFWDLYAPKADPELWTPEVFALAHKACLNDALLISYSSASRVRRALSEAGFVVSPGPGTELKRESTHARVERIK